MNSFKEKELENKIFSKQDLSYADFSNSICKECNFSLCQLSYANFTGATLINCSFNQADVNQANFRYAILTNCDLSEIKNKSSAKYLEMTCPETGAFLAYKQCYNFRIVQLLVPADAKRSSATNNTCRCNKAKVLSIKSIDFKEVYQEAVSLVDEHFIYRVGEIIEPDSYNEDRWIDSTHGIHFYMTRDEAIHYLK
ncbi:MAG: pentapeptide repeat-containing protein [Vagococcus sp.]|uniref:pentapeptide repeat-containing protein n=1 Tax=Vagococcus sp. TaxID=1933889 RepID=UPI002FCB5F93